MGMSTSKTTSQPGPGISSHTFHLPALSYGTCSPCWTGYIIVVEPTRVGYVAVIPAAKRHAGAGVAEPFGLAVSQMLGMVQRLWQCATSRNAGCHLKPDAGLIFQAMYVKLPLPTCY